jgi:DNA topoisomerase-1
MDAINLATAMELFKLPRTLGQTTDGETITTNVGRFGPYVKYGSKYVSLKEHDPYDVTLEQALATIKAKQEADANRTITDFGTEGDGIQVLNGRYGPYVTNGKKNAKIPKDRDPKTLTLEECRVLIEQAPERGAGRFGRGRRGAAGKQAAPAKRAAAGKSAAKGKNGATADAANGNGARGNGAGDSGTKASKAKRPRPSAPAANGTSTANATAASVKPTAAKKTSAAKKSPAGKKPSSAAKASNKSATASAAATNKASPGNAPAAGQAPPATPAVSGASAKPPASPPRGEK